MRHTPHDQKSLHIYSSAAIIKDAHLVACQVGPHVLVNALDGVVTSAVPHVTHLTTDNDWLLG